MRDDSTGEHWRKSREEGGAVPAGSASAGGHRVPDLCAGGNTGAADLDLRRADVPDRNGSLLPGGALRGEELPHGFPRRADGAFSAVRAAVSPRFKRCRRSGEHPRGSGQSLLPDGAGPGGSAFSLSGDRAAFSGGADSRGHFFFSAPFCGVRQSAGLPDVIIFCTARRFRRTP